MVHRHLPSPDSHLDWQPFWAAERRERRQKAFPVRETTGALTRQVIRRRCPTDAACFGNVRPLCDRVRGHHGKGIRGCWVAEFLRAVTARTSFGGGDSESPAHAK